MDPICIDGHLVQAKLERALKAIVGAERWRGREVQLPGSRRRWDMSYELDGKVTVVEFDGDEHYRNTLKIKADREKDKVAGKCGYEVIRIPYWLQLTTETLAHYFQLSAVIQQEFPHGFVTTKIFPASFCELGLMRFERELNSLPESVRETVIESLRARAVEHGAEYVIPAWLRDAI